jgi:hypothetical protein
LKGDLDACAKIFLVVIQQFVVLPRIDGDKLVLGNCRSLVVNPAADRPAKVEEFNNNLIFVSINETCRIDPVSFAELSGVDFGLCHFHFQFEGISPGCTRLNVCDIGIIQIG